VPPPLAAPSAAPGAAPDAVADAEADALAADAALRRCGDGVLDPTEQCDDGNAESWDGCSLDCFVNQALAVDTIEFMPAEDGCDLDGDGTPDNQFSATMNIGSLLFVNDHTRNQIADSPDVFLWVLERMEEPSGVADQMFSLFIGSGIDTDDPPDPSNSFTGSALFYMARWALDASGQPRFPGHGEIVGGELRLGCASSLGCPPIADVPLFFTTPPTTVKTARNTTLGRLMTDGSRVTGMEAHTCGAVLAGSLHDVHFQFIQDRSVLDAFAVGFTVFSARIGPLGPDIDLDGDGIESFVDLDRDGLIDVCRDGDGVTEIQGYDCPRDPRIADAYSFKTHVRGVSVRLAGIEPEAQ
jgi:cysteine-rich repeat protein